jgi:hypothetical protein
MLNLLARIVVHSYVVTNHRAALFQWLYGLFVCHLLTSHRSVVQMVLPSTIGHTNYPHYHLSVAI